MEEQRKKSIKIILFSLLLIVVGVILFVLAVQRVESGWYRIHYNIRPARREAFALLWPLCLVFVGCFNLYRGVKGKSFQWQFDRMFSSYEDGSPYSCPHCGAKLKQGQFSCKICGRKVF